MLCIATAVAEPVVPAVPSALCPPRTAAEIDRLRSLGGAEVPLWTTNARASTQMVEALQHADDFGLRVSDYCGAALAAALRIPTAARDAAAFDIALTTATLRLLDHLQRGRVAPRDAGFDLPTPERTFDAARALRRLAAADDPAIVIAEYEPQNGPYRELRRALPRYRALAQQPELWQLEPLPRYKVMAGDRYAGAPKLRRLLSALGDLAADAAYRADDVIDRDLVLALQRFQSRHGLDADGVLGARTYAALTTPLSLRVRQIELTLERWRWLPALQAPMVIINVPQYELFALPRNAREPLLEMPIVVGESQPLRRTPLFAAAIQQVVFQPYWDIPRSILVNELLPHIRRTPEFLQRNHMEIVAGETDASPVLPATATNIDRLAAGLARLRQRPGPDNALGPVKFVLPNRYHVFLHGTPATALFARSRRDFSHGCIRVAEPARLAAYVLENAATQWSELAIEQAMCGPANQRVVLARPVPVLILYGTALATQHGMLFFDDIYGRDRELEQLLRLTPVQPR